MQLKKAGLQMFKYLKVTRLNIFIAILIFCTPLRSFSITTSEIPKLNESIKYQDIFFTNQALIATELDAENNLTRLYDIDNENKILPLINITGEVKKILEVNNGFLVLQRIQEENSFFTEINYYSNLNNNSYQNTFKQSEKYGFAIKDFSEANENLLLILEKPSTKDSIFKTTEIVLIKKYLSEKPEIKKHRFIKRSEIASITHSEDNFYILSREFKKSKLHKDFFRITETIFSINSNGRLLLKAGSWYGKNKSEIENLQYHFTNINYNKQNKFLLTAVYDTDFSKSFSPNILFTELVLSITSQTSDKHAFLDDRIVRVLASNENKVYLLTDSKAIGSTVSQPKIVSFTLDGNKIGLPPTEYDYLEYSFTQERIKSFKMNPAANIVILSVSNGSFLKSSF